MKKERKCFMCGSHYEWCNTCHDFDPTETWKYLYHDENCLEISRIWYAYRGNEISKAEARKQMDQFPENIAMILEYDSVPAKEIKEIYGVSKKEEPQIEIDVIEEDEEGIPNIEVPEPQLEKTPEKKEPVKNTNNNTGYRNRKNNKK